MNKLVIPAILVSITLIAGIFAFVPVEKASTVHTTIQGTQFNEFKSVFVDDTSVSNATATCGSGSDGLVFWTVSNSTIGDAGNALLTSTFTIVTDGDTSDGDDLQIVLSTNQTAVSGVVSIAGTTATDFNIGFTSAASQNIGDILVTIQCQSGDTSAASAVAP